MNSIGPWLCRHILMLTIVTSGLAGAADNRQPIQIEADSLTVEESTGISTYSGNVAVTQGARQLHAEQVRIFSENEQIIRIVASVPAAATSLARYQRLADDDQDEVEGQARSITYYVREERLEFVGEATLSQSDETTVSGETVNYDAAAGRVDASGGDERVKTTIRQGTRDQ